LKKIFYIKVLILNYIMSSKLYSILNILSRKPKTQLSNYEFSSRLSKNTHYKQYNSKNSLLLLWNNKDINENQVKPIKKQIIIEEDPFKLINNYKSETPKNKLEKPKEKSKEKSIENKSKNIQECLIKTLFPEYEISLNKEGFIKEFRNFLALKGNEIFPEYKYISKIIKKIEFGEELMQSKTIFKLEWFSVISIIFFINIVYFKGFLNYTNFKTYLPIDKNKRTLIINEVENTFGKEIKGEIKEDISEIIEKINPNYTKNELEKMKLDDIQKYAKYLGIMIFKEGKVGFRNKTKEEIINEIFPEIINEL
jgi:hypothetical protein